MAVEQYVILALSLVLVFQTWFYLNKVDDLVNKLMSRDYGDYVQAKKYSEFKEEKQLKNEPAVDPFEQQRARDLNAGILGLE